MFQLHLFSIRTMSLLVFAYVDLGFHELDSTYYLCKQES